MSSFNPATMNPAAIVLDKPNDNIINNLLLVILLIIIIIYVIRNSKFT
jgi:hypothetical protein